MSEEMLLIGDDAVHGEDAYSFSDLPENILYAGTGQVPIHDIEAASPNVGKGSPSNNNGDGPDPIKAS